MIDKLLVSIVIDDVFAGIFVSVPAGHVSAIYDRGRGVLKKVLKPGLHLKLPFWQKAKLFNVQTLEYTLRKVSEGGKGTGLHSEPVVATTADGVRVEVEGTVLFRLDQDRIPEIWQTTGENFFEKVVKPVTRNRIGSGISSFKSSQIFSPERERVEEAIQAKLGEAFRARGIILEDFLLGSTVIQDDMQGIDRDFTKLTTEERKSEQLIN